MNFSKIVLCAAVVSAVVSAANAVDYKACQARVEALEKLAERSDYASGKAEAESILSDGDMPLLLKIRAASYLAIGCIDKSDDYASADKLYTDLMAENAGRIGPDELAALVDARANLFVIRGDQDGALSLVESERRKYPCDGAFGRSMEPRFDKCVSKVYAAFLDFRGELGYFEKRGDKSRVFSLLCDKVSDAARADKLAHELVAEAKKPVEARRAWLWRRQSTASARSSACPTARLFPR